MGALAVGEWADLDRVRDAIDEPKGPSFWDLRRFRSTGSLWETSESPPVYEWPADALVCGCLGVRRGALRDAEAEGCDSVAALSARTGAGTAYDYELQDQHGTSSLTLNSAVTTPT